MSTFLLCETVTGRSTAELRAARDAATIGDLVELRLDGVADLDVAGALADRRRPVIATCRPTWECGAFDGSEEDRSAILARAFLHKVFDLEHEIVGEGAVEAEQGIVIG